VLSCVAIVLLSRFLIPSCEMKHESKTIATQACTRGLESERPMGPSGRGSGLESLLSCHLMPTVSRPAVRSTGVNVLTSCYNAQPLKTLL
jgi:hypothetical protein